MGQSYLLGCPEGGEQRLLEAVERVDTAMCKIRDAGKVKARDRIAVLAALNLAFELAMRRAPDLPPPPAPRRARRTGTDGTRGRAGRPGRPAAAPGPRAGPGRACSALQQRFAAPLECDARKRLQSSVCSACRALYFLEPMLFEPGPGTSPGERDRLASDEPNARLTSPT
jgi:cell division protein ZapA